jgi:hypothetical protein
VCCPAKEISFPVIPLGVLREKAMKKNSKKEKEGELWPPMLQPSFCYKIQSSHIIIAHVSCTYTTWFSRHGIEYFSREEQNRN